MREILTPDAPKPGGHYTQAIVHKETVYISGILPIDPHTGNKKVGSVEDQTHQVLTSMDAILKAAGSSRDKVIKTTVYISDIDLWDSVNQIYAEFFGQHRPARSVVPTQRLHFGFQIEIEAIATLS